MLSESLTSDRAASDNEEESVSVDILRPRISYCSELSLTDSHTALKFLTAFPPLLIIKVAPQDSILREKADIAGLTNMTIEDSCLGKLTEELDDSEWNTQNRNNKQDYFLFI